MATKNVYLPLEHAPYCVAVEVNYEYFGGFAVSQKQRCVRSLHDAFLRVHPERRILEISRFSMQENGDRLSAFNLEKFVPSLGRPVRIENIFQSAKKFSGGGPYTDLLEAKPGEAKIDERLKSSGQLVAFVWEGREYPLKPPTAFYDYLYISALREERNAHLAATLLEYNAFSDIAFNDKKSLNCQAKAAATYVALVRAGLIDRVSDYDSYVSALGAVPAVTPTKQPEPEPVEEKPAFTLQPGDTVLHKLWGEGSILAVDGTKVKIRFASVGEKLLGAEWLAANCRIGR